MLRPLGAPVRHLQRYQEIAQVLFRHGFDNVADMLRLRQFLSLSTRLIGIPRPSEHLSTAQHLRLSAEELGPTFIKLGQMLSTRPDLLPADYLHELAKLRDRVPPFPFEEVRRRVEAELGVPMEEAFQLFDEEPIAAASLGQVHAAVLPDGSEVVVKVLRPRIRETVDADLDILFELASFAEQRTRLGKMYPLTELVEEFATTLRGELDYVREAQNAERFARNFAHRSDLRVPKVYWDYTTHSVLTLERLRGIPIDHVEELRAANLDPKQVATTAVDLIMQETFKDGFFHADPHPGNFCVMEDNVIGAMDFGMVGYIDRRTKEQLLRLFVALVSRDADQVAAELVHMEMVGGGVDHRRLARDLHRFLERYWSVPLKDLTFGAIFDDLLPIAFRHRLTLPSNLWLLGKVLVMMEGTGQLLYPELDVFEVARPYALEAVRQMKSPMALAERIGRGTQDWGDLWLTLPQRLPRLLDQLDKGELTFIQRLTELDATVLRLDRMVTRLAAAVLVAALVIGTALILPSLPSPTWVPWSLVGMGVAVSLGVGLWLLWSMLRSGRR